ncbi:hypothetical protein [Nocardioides convexus]|uniref:hypothetical protein n=1 Tax=Nocardioides convexus TaxID=2712224 RepID=UPI00241817BF|nr:hypothetical protein [Nocardioides convexus]
MDGDKQSSGTPRSVTVEASDGSVIADKRAYAGRARESITYDKAGGTPFSGAIYTPWSVVTAGSGLKAASFVGTAETRSRSILANGQWRRRTVDQDYDDNTGQVTRVSDSGDTAVSGDETCTATDYADTQTATGAWFVGYPSRVVSSRGICGTDALTPSESDVLADSRTRYDNLAQGVAPTRGLVTATDRLKAYSGGAPVYQQVMTTAYDAYGRTTSTTSPSAQRLDLHLHRHHGVHDVDGRHAREHDQHAGRRRQELRHHDHDASRVGRPHQDRRSQQQADRGRVRRSRPRRLGVGHQPCADGHAEHQVRLHTVEDISIGAHQHVEPRRFGLHRLRRDLRLPCCGLVRPRCRRRAANGSLPAPTTTPAARRTRPSPTFTPPEHRPARWLSSPRAPSPR